MLSLDVYHTILCTKAVHAYKKYSWQTITWLQRHRLVHDYHMLLRNKNSGQTDILQRHVRVLNTTVQRHRLAIRHKLVDDRLRFHDEEEHVLVIVWPAIDGRKPLHPERELLSCDPWEEKRDGTVAKSPLKLRFHLVVDEGCAETGCGGWLERPAYVLQIQL